MSERPMIIRMTTTARPQQRYDHRLRDLVQRTGDVTIATDLGVPRSTARGWLGKAPKVVVSLDVTDLRASELQQEVLELRRRVKKLTALLRLALALLRSSGFTLTHERLPDGRAKIRILRAVDRAREFVPLRALLRFLRLSPSRFHAWRRLQHACALDDQSSCPHTSPHRLTRGSARIRKPSRNRSTFFSLEPVSSSTPSRWRAEDVLVKHLSVSPEPPPGGFRTIASRQLSQSLRSCPDVTPRSASDRVRGNAPSIGSG